jgi:hypothetical protein
VTGDASGFGELKPCSHCLSPWSSRFCVVVGEGFVKCEEGMLRGFVKKAGRYLFVFFFSNKELKN